MRIGRACLALAEAERGALFPWIAVLYGAGIALYFAPANEPPAAAFGGAGALCIASGLLAVVSGPGWRPLALVLLVPALGFLVAGARAHAVAETTLAFRYYGPVEGRVVGLDRSQSDALRITLDRVVLARTAPDRTPARVRVALFGQEGLARPAPGATVILTGHLSPPGGPVEPGGYDFRRHAWFEGLGAVGYTRTPVLAYARAGSGDARLLRLRLAVADHVRRVLPGRAGGFAAAITTGDRSSLDQPTLDALRATNLAHLLAISGLHMGLLTGFVFAALRTALALSPAFSLRRPAKKAAALGALAAGAAYLALSGNNVATERAFIMVAVMFGAVLADRRAVTLRAVALAALVVLTLRPESLTGPGFQMSFAATTALVAVYGWMRERDWSESRWPFWLRLAGGVALSSAIAGLATAPVAAAHFNQVPHYSLLANILTVPLMGAVIMPGAVIAALLAPFGLSWIGLRLMEPAILWILAVAEEIAAWPGALSFVPAPPPAVLPLLAVAGAGAALFRARAFRAAGLPAAALALWLWTGVERPLVLVAESGGQAGVLTSSGRAVARARGDGFSVDSWLENDGDGAGQADAADRPGWRQEGALRVIDLGRTRLLLGTGKGGGAAARARCAEGVVITNASLDAVPGCTILDARRLRETGAVALDLASGAVRVRPARAGRRLWSE